MKKVLRKFAVWLLLAIPRRYRIEMLRILGRSFGVRAFTCYGDLGLFQGSIDDQTVHSLYLLHGTYSPGLQIILSRMFSDNHGTLIDVGANIGFTAIPLVKGRSGINCMAFEPEHDNYLFLRMNIIANDVSSRIKPYNLAIFSEDGVLEMELSGVNMGDHRIRTRPPAKFDPNYYREVARKTVKVKARKLDNVLNVDHLDKPIIMKIDVQGSEVKVFYGAERILAKVDYIIAEFWPYGINRVGDAIDSYIDVVKRFPYGAIFDEESEKVPELSPIDKVVARLLEIPSDGTSIQHCNVVLSRSPVI